MGARRPKCGTRATDEEHAWKRKPAPTFEGREPEYLTTLKRVAPGRDLLGLICMHGGGEPSHIRRASGGLRAGPGASGHARDAHLRLRVRRALPFPREDNAFQRRMDLHILQRLHLVPGDTRPARELFRRAALEITSLDGICVFEHPTANWPNWPRVRGRVRGWSAEPLPDPQTREQTAQAKLDSVAEIEASDRLYLRPHHLMCITCFYGGGGDKPLEIDNLWEPLVRIKANPEIEITFVEGDCMVCPPCPGHDPKSGTCIRVCGLKTGARISTHSGCSTCSRRHDAGTRTVRSLPRAHSARARGVRLRRGAHARMARLRRLVLG